MKTVARGTFTLPGRRGKIAEQGVSKTQRDKLCSLTRTVLKNHLGGDKVVWRSSLKGQDALRQIGHASNREGKKVKFRSLREVT